MIHTDVALIGASLGGVQAAISLLHEGRTVVMTELSPWVGGQLTSQAVPPDEHPWIEEFGCTRRYRNFRNRIRKHYLDAPGFRGDLPDNFDPGNSTVSRLSHLPSLAHELLRDDLAPFLVSGQCVLMTGYRPVKGKRTGREIRSVTVRNGESGESQEIRAGLFIDGTDQGDLLPLVGTAYFLGSDSRRDTGEPSAPPRGDRKDLQPVTWVLSLGLHTGESPIAEPPGYGEFRRLVQPYDSHPVFSRFGPDGATGKAREFAILDYGEDKSLFSLWSYRRIQFPPYHGRSPGLPDLTLLNWPQNDYFLGNIIEDERADYHFHRSREFSFSFLYWLQTEAPRPEGGRGYPEIGLVKDVLGTRDGAAQFPYVREGRRPKTLCTVKEQDISREFNDSPRRYGDSIGVGSYHLDRHVTTSTHSFYYREAVPFEIPLGALIPQDTANLITASKNIGTTHITNGSFRLHPVEWNIGEAAGYAAHFCLKKTITPAELRKNHLDEFQDFLDNRGLERSWPGGHEEWMND